MRFVEVPWRELSATALDGVIEEYVTREGTEYGMHDVELSEKVVQIRRQLERSEVLVFFDTALSSCQLIAREEARRLRALDTEGLVS